MLLNIVRIDSENDWHYDGIVFYVEKEEKENEAEQGDKYLTVYIVSFFDEYNDFRKWYTEKNK